MTTTHVQPAFIDECHNYCSRVVYIDLVGMGGNPTQRGNIRAKFAKEMKTLNWYPRRAATSFLFYKRLDGGNDAARNEVETAIRNTQVTYPGAQFDYAVLKPVSTTRNDIDFGGIFESMFEENPGQPEEPEQ